MTDSTQVTVGPQGAVTLPEEIQRQIGVHPGSVVVLRVEGDQLVLISREAIKRRIRGMFAGVEDSLADELIAERQAEAERENELT